ncbi:MAG: hypothetical protein ACR2LC_15290 [Pyrinomonadaceae bacterium]
MHHQRNSLLHIGAVILFIACAVLCYGTRRGLAATPNERSQKIAGASFPKFGIDAAPFDSQKAAKLREEALDAYRKALKTIETIRQGSLRADEARTTFLATTKDVYDEAAAALAEMSLANRASNNSALTGAALQNAAEAFSIIEAGRARSLLELLAESHAEITSGVSAECG